MAKVVRLNELISTWLDTKSNLMGHIQIIDWICPSEIQARIHGLDVYDPYVCIAVIHEDRILFRTDLYLWPLAPSIREYNNGLLAADPQFFEELEKALLYYIDL